MIFRKANNTNFEFSLDLDQGVPRLTYRNSDHSAWQNLGLNQTIEAAKLLVDAASNWPKYERPKGTLYCSFCGKSQYDVKKLIAGPNSFICNECVDLCSDIVKEISR